MLKSFVKIIPDLLVVFGSILTLFLAVGLTYFVEHGMNGVFEGPKLIWPLTAGLAVIPLVFNFVLNHSKTSTILALIMTALLPLCYYNLSEPICAIKKFEWPAPSEWRYRL